MLIAAFHYAIFRFHRADVCLFRLFFRLDADIFLFSCRHSYATFASAAFLYYLFHAITLISFSLICHYFLPFDDYFRLFSPLFLSRCVCAMPPCFSFSDDAFIAY